MSEEELRKWHDAFTFAYRLYKKYRPGLMSLTEEQWRDLVDEADDWAEERKDDKLARRLMSFVLNELEREWKEGKE